MREELHRRQSLRLLVAHPRFFRPVWPVSNMFPRPFFGNSAQSICSKSLSLVVGAPRFELGTPSPPDWCANRAALRSDARKAVDIWAFLAFTPSGRKPQERERKGDKVPRWRTESRGKSRGLFTLSVPWYLRSNLGLPALGRCRQRTSCRSQRRSPESPPTSGAINGYSYSRRSAGRGRDVKDRAGGYSHPLLPQVDREAAALGGLSAPPRRLTRIWIGARDTRSASAAPNGATCGATWADYVARIVSAAAGQHRPFLCITRLTNASVTSSLGRVDGFSQV